MPRRPEFMMTSLNVRRDFQITKLIDSKGQMRKVPKRGSMTRSRRRSSTSKRRKSRRRMY